MTRRDAGRPSPTDATKAAETSRLSEGGASLHCRVVPWDSDTFGFAVAEIQDIDIVADADAGRLFAAFDMWCAEREVRLVSCRLDHVRLREAMALEARGFRFVEMVYSPQLHSLASVSAPRHAMLVSEAAATDMVGIEDIARDAFDTGRFALDVRLDPALSGRRYANWARHSFRSPDQSLLKAQIDGALVGFFILEHRADRSVYWHLTAVARRWQGAGIGTSLWRTMLLRHRTEGVATVETTISGHNLAALNLYARLGFTFTSPKMTYHLVAGEPKP